MKVIILEDETAAATHLAGLLADCRPDMQIQAVLESVTESVAWLNSNPAPDLIFSDIRLADGNAFTVFSRVNADCPVVFTTAYDSYALEAFGVNSIDYLLKPVKASDLERAVSKLERLTGSQRGDYARRLRDMAASGNVRVLLVRRRDRIIPVKTGDVAYCHSSDEKTTVGTLGGETYPVEKSLEALERMLPGSDFFRANRQFIISREAVRDITVWFGSRLSVNLTVETPERIIVSKAKVPLLRRWLAGTD